MVTIVSSRNSQIVFIVQERVTETTFMCVCYNKVELIEPATLLLEHRVHALCTSSQTNVQYECPYIIFKVIPPSTYELPTTKGKIRGEFNKRALKPYLEEENPCAGGRN